MIRKIVPAKVLLLLKLLFRSYSDYTDGLQKKFAKVYKQRPELPHFIETRQFIRKAAFYENKIHNIKLAVSKIESVIIMPEEVFSFWNIVGKPSESKGYKKGRNLVSGKLKEDFGGGLCQLSGIIYHTALKAGLTILERYNHSLDIYKEEERFTPLGADATIVFGYKDLRILNDTKNELYFCFQINSDELICRLHSSDFIEECRLEFGKEILGDKVMVAVGRISDSNKELIGISSYIKLHDQD